jgi:arylsulfatase A-like enzyme
MKRQVLTLPVLLALAAATSGARAPLDEAAAVQAQTALAKRPNIVLVIADDWSFPHAGAYGDRTVSTPNFDRVAREGALFTHAFTAAPSCTPSRAALLTGQAPHRLEEGGNLHGFLPKSYPVYPDLLEESGYVVGFTGKGWGPGRFEPGGRSRNPAGPVFKSFDEFLQQRTADRPFCYLFGSTDPHRPYDPGSGAQGSGR